MKTISQVVDGLSEKQLKDIAMAKYSRMANEEVHLTLASLNREGQLGHERGTSETLRGMLMEGYESKKRELQGLDLWNPEFDRLYRSALEGRLSPIDTYGVGVRLE